jgi:hypothetical protein
MTIHLSAYARRRPRPRAQQQQWQQNRPRKRRGRSHRQPPTSRLDHDINQEQDGNNSKAAYNLKLTLSRRSPVKYFSKCVVCVQYKLQEMQNVHACSEFQNFCSYVVEIQKIGRKPYFINFFLIFFCPAFFALKFLP